MVVLPILGTISAGAVLRIENCASERLFARMQVQIKPTRTYAAFMAAISGSMPMMLMTRLRL